MHRKHCGKRWNCSFEQFYLFPQCFPKAFFFNVLKWVNMEEGVKVMSLSFKIYQAVQFLHELGSLQHFTTETLKSKVVVNPQWIVDVMACVVSVKNSPIKVLIFVSNKTRICSYLFYTVWSGIKEGSCMAQR